MNLGILSSYRVGNYRVAGRDLNLNPDLNGVSLYFTREKDAKKYKKLHSKAEYPVVIEQIRIVY